MLGADKRRLRRMSNTLQAGPREGGGKSDRLPASGGKATPVFGFAQGHESFDIAQDRESLDVAQDREPFDVAPDRELVEWQMMP